MTFDAAEKRFYYCFFLNSAASNVMVSRGRGEVMFT